MILILFLSLSYCDQYDQAERIMRNLDEIQSDILIQQDIMKSISNQISIITNNLENANITLQKNQNNIKSIKDHNDKLINQATNVIHNSIQDTLSSNLKSLPVNISLVSFSSKEEKKGIDFIPRLKAQYITRFNPPSYPRDINGFYKIKGKSANFTFLSHHVERIAKIEINQTDATECSVKAFKATFTDHQNIFTSEVFSVKSHSEKPQVFYLNRTIWFKSMVLNVTENFGGDYICLPNVRVFDNDFYSGK